MMNLAPRLILTQTQPMSETVFPAVDLLLDEMEFQKALNYVAGRKDMNRYRSMVDFLFSELMGGKWKSSCFRYYNGNGYSLNDDPLITSDMLDEWEKQICMALYVACDDMSEKRTCSWKGFRKRWQQKLAA